MSIRRQLARPRPSWAWQDDAACRGEDLVLFFGPDGERQPERDVRERKAKAICAQCPSRAACLDYALSRPEKYGLYGGLNEDERASERRRRMRRANMAGISAEPIRPEPEPVTDKPCPRCGETKTADMFGSDQSRRDGLNVTCKECTNAKKRERLRVAKQAVA